MNKNSTNRLMLTFKPNQYNLDDIIKTIKKYETIKEAYYILHDKDDTEPHYHFAIYTKTPYDLDYWQEKLLSNIFPLNQLEIWDAWNKCKAYLTHKLTSEMDKGKYLYDDSEVITIKGSSYRQDVIENKSKNGDLDKIIDLIESDKLKPYNISDFIDAKTYVKYKKHIMDAYEFHLNKLTKERKDKNMDVYYFYGAAGTGKTTYAKYMAQTLPDSDGTFICDGGKHPFDSYGGEASIIMDDFRDDTMSLQEFLKLCDNNTNSSVKARYYNKNLMYCKHLFITSNVSPKDIFKYDNEDRNQIYRRLKIFHFRFNASDTTKRNIVVDYQEFNSQYGLITKQTFNYNLDALLISTKVIENTSEILFQAFADTLNKLSDSDKEKLKVEIENILPDDKPKSN